MGVRSSPQGVCRNPIPRNLRAEIGAQTASWFKALEPYRDNWDWTIVRAPPAVKEAIGALRLRFGVTSSFGDGEVEEIAVVRLIAIIFTVISAANVPSEKAKLFIRQAFEGISPTFSLGHR